MKKVALSLVTMVTMSSFAFAGGDIESVQVVPLADEGVSPFYVGLGLSASSTRSSRDSLGSFDDKNTEDDTGDILLMVGYEFNQYIGVEGRYMTSEFGEDALTRDSWGVYVKPQYPVTEAFTLYALLGYGGLNVETNGLALGSLDDTGFQWGLGASYDLNVHFSIFFDYVNVANDMDAESVFDLPFAAPFSKVDSDAFSAGITYNF